MREEIKKQIQENLVDDYLNFNDSSVGIFAPSVITKAVVNEIEFDTDNEIKVNEWKENYMVVEAGGQEFKVERIVQHFTPSIGGRPEVIDAYWKIVD
jgi:hypothetical protein